LAAVPFPSRRLAPGSAGPARPWATAAGIGLALVAVGHVLAIAPHYRVGSFDDDAGYIMVAKALAAGHGLTSILPAGIPLVAVYPPGYPALLAPMVWLGGHDVSFRALSLVLVALLFPLIWRYLDRRRISAPARVAVLALLALNPVLATYGTMVMAEVAFLVVLVVLLLLVDRWPACSPRPAWAPWSRRPPSSG
jgi:hypothetical protein